MTVRRIVGWSALVAVAAGVAAFSFLALDFWRSIQHGELQDPRDIAGRDTVALISFTLTADDPGVRKVIAHLQEDEGRAKSSHLPRWAGWANWLLSGSGATSESSSPTGNNREAALSALMPVRIVVWLDRKPEGILSAANAGDDRSLLVPSLVVSLSHFSDKIETLLGAEAIHAWHGVPVAAPVHPGEPFSALVGNNIVVTEDDSALHIAIDRLRTGGASRAFPIDAAWELIPGQAAGEIAIANDRGALDELARSVLARQGIVMTTAGSPVRLVPHELLGAGFSVTMDDSDKASFEGTIRFTDEEAAAKGIHWLKRGTPAALTLIGLQVTYDVKQDGDQLEVEGALSGLESLWDRLLAGKLIRLGR